MKSKSIYVWLDVDHPIKLIQAGGKALRLWCITENKLDDYEYHVLCRPRH